MKIKISNSKNIIWGLLIVFASVMIDQLTKYIISCNFSVGSRNVITIIKDFIYISHVRNTGAAWSILQGNAFVLVGLTSVILLIVFIFMFYTNRLMLTIPIAMIAGGGIGNLIDRLFRKGGVVDFVDVYIFGYDFPVFNAADSILICGTGILLVYILFFYKDDKKGYGKTIRWMK